MHKEEMKDLLEFENILTKDLGKELKKVIDAGTINNTEVKNITDAICLMLKSKEYETWMKNPDMMEESSYRNYGEYSYAPHRSSITGRFTSRGIEPRHDDMYYEDHSMRSYDNRNMYDKGYSGHSTKDRIISRIEDMMGEAKNEYEANKIRMAIDYVQSNM